MNFLTSNILRDIKKHAEEIRLQLALGKSEARDFFVTHSRDLEDFLVELREKISSGSGIGEEKAAMVRGKVDAVRVQIALGKMDGRDAFLAKREKIGAGLADLQAELAVLSDKAGGAIAGLGDELERRGDAFRSRLDALALNLGLGGVIAEDQVRAAKDDLCGRLKSVSDKAASAAERAEKKLGRVAGETLDEMEEIIHRLREKVGRE